MKKQKKTKTKRSQKPEQERFDCNIKSAVTDMCDLREDKSIQSFFIENESRKIATKRFMIWCSLENCVTTNLQVV